MFQLLFPLFLLISQIRCVESVPYDEKEEQLKLNKCNFTLNTQQFEQFGPKCKAESLNFSLAFDINITYAKFFAELDSTRTICKWVFICYKTSFDASVKPQYKLRKGNKNNVSVVCSASNEGIGLEICGERQKKGTIKYDMESLELSFTQEIFQLKEESKNPKILINDNDISVQLQSLLMLWNVEKMKLLKHIQFYNGRNALQKTANHWLFPIDVFGSWKNGKLKIFSLAPEGVMISEKNELLNGSHCTQPTTTPKMTTIPKVTSSLASTQTTNMAISTPTTQTGAGSTGMPTLTTTTIQTEPTSSSAPPCDEKCQQSKIDAIEREIVKLEEFCKPEELPSKANERKTVNLDFKPPALRCSDKNTYIDIVSTVQIAQELLNSMKKRCNGTSIVEIHEIPVKTWDLPIHYIFNKTTITDELRETIEEAIKMIEAESCIKFEEIKESDEELKDVPYLEFIAVHGCYSYLGQVVSEGKQTIYIFEDTREPGEALHLILHALGIPHEHVREDRGDKVWINWENINLKERPDFDKLTTQQFGTPYDHGSIMHLGPIAHNVDSKKYTIITKDHHFQHTIGQRAKMSFKDAKLLNKLYKCYAGCTRRCGNGGYPDPKNCGGPCKCPAPFQGGTCYLDIDCKRVKVNRDGQYYVPEQKCLLFRESSDTSKKYMLTIKEIQLPDEHDCPMTCEHSYVEIKAKADPIATGARICCTKLLPMEMEVKTNTYILLQGEITVKFEILEKPGKV